MGYGKKDETILLRGEGPDYGIQPLMTSYRSKLGGMIFIEQDLIPKKDKGAYNHV
jgi:hypothetical protein